MSCKEVFAKRLKELRLKAGLSQREFAVKLSSFIGATSIMSVSSISSWELGEKIPSSFEILTGMANFFNVSVDYLVGRKNIAEDKDITSFFDLKEFTVEIEAENLKNYSGKPVYIVFSDTDNNRWGIYNAETDLFSCANVRVKNTSNLRYFALPEERYKKK